MRTGSGEPLCGCVGVEGRPPADTGRPELRGAGWRFWDACSLLFKASRARQAEAKYSERFSKYEHKPVGFNQLMRNELRLGPARARLAEQAPVQACACARPCAHPGCTPWAGGCCLQAPSHGFLPTWPGHPPKSLPGEESLAI